MPNATPALTPRFVTKAQAIEVIGSRKLVERMLHASKKSPQTPWLKVIPPRPGTACRDTLIDLGSVHIACDRLLAGEHPPLFPSEQPKPPGPDIEAE